MTTAVPTRSLVASDAAGTLPSAAGALPGPAGTVPRVPVPELSGPSVTSRRPLRAVPGPIRFARYAYGPNRLGYCGPEEVQELFEQATAGAEDAALRSLARQFEGAYPYLELIARSNDIADPLDARVVEAYWLGNGLLDRVRPSELGPSLERRFRARLHGDGWQWLATKPEAGAVPVHAFHVLDVFPRLGLMRTGETDRALEVMDSCRIRWGRVLERDGDWLVVSAVPLEMAEAKLRLGPPRVERIRGWIDGAGFVDDVEVGDVVSIHWDWACERLDAQRLDALRSWTLREIGIANRTM
ncbi:MAG TPA: DUF6390 family protein [Candidatus Limnocylindrales bacterium]|nr:DUF6390 family protein [Candidatus Limnocylindrales bacterium]